jgi:hypothetical protein
MSSSRRFTMRRVKLALVATALPVAAAAGVLSLAGTARASATPTPLVGTFELTPGSTANATASGTYFRMLDPSAANNTSDTSYVSNSNSTASDQTYTLLTPGIEGGLVTGAYEPEPSPAFDSSGNSLAGDIIQPTGFFGVNFGLDTNPVDPQTGDDVPAPAISTDGEGNLSGNLEAFGASWNSQEFNQGSPKPGGTYPGSSYNATEPVSGTYNATTGAYVLTWQSIIVGGPFNNFTGVWHLAGTFVPAAPTVTGVNPATGPAAGGTSVTITGTNLTGASAVDFGGAAASHVSVVSATSVTATSPAGSGAVDVTVTTPGGTSATSTADQFTYQAPVIPAPTVTGVSPATGPAAGGTSVTITGTNLTGASAVDFGGAAATDVTVVSPTSITATSPAGSGTVDVTVTTPGGTSAASSADEFTYQAASTSSPDPVTSLIDSVVALVAALLADL